MMTKKQAGLRAAMLMGCAGLALLPGLTAVSAQAQTAPARSYSLKAQSLDEALTQLSRDSGQEIIYAADLVRGKRIAAVSRATSLEAALNSVLRGTGLSWRHNDSGAILIVSGAARSPERRTRPAAVKNTVSAGETIDEIVVTGQRGANQDAIAIKRRERNIVDAVSSDEAQRLPDLTIVNALRRIPGVSVLPVADNEHPRDEAIAPVLRGLNQSYNNVTINGLPIASPGIPDSSSGNATRGVRLDILPTSLVKQIVVVKTFTPDLDPNAVGGAVDLRTRSAFDGGGAPFLAIDAGIANTSEKGLPHPQDDFGRRLSLTASTTFGPERNFGVVFSTNYQKLENYTEVHATNDSTYYNFYNDNGKRVTGNDLGNGIAVPQQDKNWYNESSRERWSATGRLEGRFGDVSIFGMAGYYKFTDGYNRNELIINGRNVDVADQTATSGRYPGASVELGYRTGTTYNQTTILQTGLDWRPSDTDVVSVRASTSRATMREPHDMVKYNAGINASGSTIALPQFAFAYDSSGFHHSFNIDPDAYYDLSLYKAAYWRHRERKAGGKVNSVRADWSHNMEANAQGLGFGAGLAYVDSRAWHGFEGYEYKTSDRNVTLAGVGTMSNAWLPYNQSGLRLLTIDNDRAWAQFDANQATITLGDPTSGNHRDNFTLWEEMRDAYAVVTWAQDRLHLLGGLRVERTNVDTENFVNVNNTWKTNRTSADYDFVLPSLLGSYDVTDNVRVRAAFSQTIGRPSYDSYVGRSSVSFENDSDIGNPDAQDVSVSLGNPDIKPRQSDNYDLSVEWRLSNTYGGLISAALFHKNIRDEIYTAKSFGYTWEGVNYRNASVSQPANAAGAQISGLELGAVVNSLEFLNPMLLNFGVSGNFSLLDGEMDLPVSTGGVRTVDRLMGQPDEIRNLSVFYSRGPLELRAAYHWTGRALRAVVADIAWQDVYWAPRKQFDVQGRYEINPGLTLVAEVSNLSEERMDSVTGPDKNLLKDSYSTPRTVWLSLSWTLGK